ncbi:transporter substrate-binding domain-containing protein [Pseudodesulfovibrio sp. zrk46]|uniref:substrate-binding periplasmic protein n=1 Tax=Pseudodesulfovibrio sp. zrk46 TaxID=2725288 RepID=UPI0014498F86|nr:transporter substrate-binding domain-containing protein [Pseudodesulfovibrio sp. zrk46]QJB55304.1 amino acid ABC transporter substrate-binding protein [Pseudodesulfovibrio sp. zrk46]
MRKIVFIAMAWLFTVSAAWCDPLVFVAEDGFPPYSYYEHGRVQGIDAEVLREAGSRAGVDVKVELVPWKRVLFMVQSGQVDGAIAMFRNEEREKIFHFSKNPVHVTNLVAFFPKGSSFRYRTIADLYDMTAFVIAGYAISAEFEEAVKQGKIRRVEVNNIADGLNRLQKQENSCFIGNRVSVFYYARRHGVADKIEPAVGPPVKKRGAYMSVSKVEFNNPDRKAEFKRLDAELGKMIRDGTTTHITDNYTR